MSASINRRTTITEGTATILTNVGAHQGNARRANDAQALITPVTVLRPDPLYWIVVGALLEDLRRVREETIDGPARPRTG